MIDPARVARRRRKFVFGVLEQAANILGAMTASIMVVGLLLPALAAASGMQMASAQGFAAVAWLVIGFAMLTGASSMLLRGLARRLEDDETDLASRPVDMEGQP